MAEARWIGKIAGKIKYLIVLLSVLQSVMAASGICFALIMRRAIDSAVAGEREAFIRNAVFLAVLIFIQLLLRAGIRLLTEESRISMENRLRQEAFREILKKDYRKAAAYHSGELMNRITSDTAVVADGAVTLVPNLISMLVRIIGVLIVLYTIEPWFTLIFLIGGCLFVAFSIIPRGRLKALHHRVQEADGVVRCFLQESLESLLVIHAFGCEKKMEKISGKKMQEYRRTFRKKNNVSTFYSTLMRLVMQGGYLLGFCWCGVGILRGNISYGTMTAVIQLIGQIQTPFAGMGNTLPKFSAMLASSERLMALAEPDKGLCGSGREPNTNDQISAAEIYEKTKAFCFEHVSFSYDKDKTVLSNVSFSVEKGEFIALVGESGIGKSTLMKLLLSVYEADEGQIYLQLSGDNAFDENVSGEKFFEGKLSVDSLPAGMFAYVPQGNHLMSGTIRQVVGFAEQSGDISMEKVIKACQTACAHAFIMELPEGYDTLLGEKGAGLSEGQMQRLAVARAIYSGCPVLLLDEATSALDAETESRMITAMKKLPDRTVFLITHREEVLGLCDRILRCGENQAVCAGKE